MSATFLVFSSLLFLPSTVPSTTKPNEQKVGKWGIKEKGFYWTPKISSLVVCGLGTVEKNQICKTRRWLPLTILELAIKALSARSLTFDQRQIEGRPWWQNGPYLCILQLCCWVEDLKINISGWWEFQPVTIPPLAETKLRSCSGRSQQNEPWNLLCISRLVKSVIFIHANLQTFSKISFSQSLAETSIEEKYGP